MPGIARNPKEIVTTDTFDDSHIYECFKCGAKHENPIGKFYRSQWSPLYLKNDRFVPLCKSCINEMFDELSRRYRSDKIACIIMCHYLDFPFSNTLFDSIIKNNNIFSIGLYSRQLNNKQWQYKNFSNSIVDGELNKTEDKVQEEREVKWKPEETKNKNTVIQIVGYDPFERFPDEDRRSLFQEIIKYFDEDIENDAFLISQIIQIVINNNQIRTYDLELSRLNPVKDAGAIKDLNEIKSKLVTSNDKIAKENEIAVRHRSNKEQGKSTITHLMRKLRELDFDKAEADYYDQLKSSGTLWALEMSEKAIRQHTMFDENDKQEIFTIQREMIQKLQRESDDKTESIRQLNVEVDQLKNQIELLKAGDKSGK